MLGFGDDPKDLFRVGTGIEKRVDHLGRNEFVFRSVNEEEGKGAFLDMLCGRGAKDVVMSKSFAPEIRGGQKDFRGK